MKYVKWGLLSFLFATIILTSRDFIQSASGIESKKISRQAIVPKRRENTSKVRSSTDSTSCIPNPDLLDGRRVYSYAEPDKAPEFPGGGGYPAFFKFFTKNLRYPKEQKEIQTSVYITFIVDKDGAIRNECIFQQFDKDRLSPLEQAALKVLKNMPKWIPAEMKGKKVDSRFTSRIGIELSE